MSHNAKSQFFGEVRLGYARKSLAYSWALPAALVSNPGTVPGSLNNPHQSQPTHWGSGFSSEKRHMVKQIIFLSGLTKFDSLFPQIMSYTWEGKRKEIIISSATHLSQASSLHTLTCSHPHHRPSGSVRLSQFNKQGDCCSGRSNEILKSTLLVSSSAWIQTWPFCLGWQHINCTACLPHCLHLRRQDPSVLSAFHALI